MGRRPTLANSSSGCKAMHEGSHQPARTATVESDVKSPALFCGGEKGKRSCAKWRIKQPIYDKHLLVLPAAAKKGDQRDLTKANVSLFSGYSFQKE